MNNLFALNNWHFIDTPIYDKVE